MRRTFVVVGSGAAALALFCVSSLGRAAPATVMSDGVESSHGSSAVESPAPVVRLDTRTRDLEKQLDQMRADRQRRIRTGELKIAHIPAHSQPRHATNRGKTADREAATPSPTPIRDDDLRCLTEAVYYEARSESEEGQRAVAQVVLNRRADPSYPQTVCGVVYERLPNARTCQFSFTCDGSIGRRPVERQAWSEARAIAQRALAGKTAGDTVATHYHTAQVHPRWSRAFKEVARIGAHIFYDGRGDRQVHSQADAARAS